MKNYQDYSLEDFVTDDNFCHWVLQPDTDSILFWDLWLRDHPEKEQIIHKARGIVNKLHSASAELVTPDVLDGIWTEIEISTGSKKSPKLINIKWISIAASFTLLIGIMGVYFYYSQTADLSEVVSDSQPSKWIENTNDSDAIMRIDLIDGSTVTLEPNSSIKYPSVFSKKRRNVILKGEAFFEISRDTSKAFYVYANDAVIRVLGTSFLVKASDEDSDVEVIVKTGKVAVYKRKEIKELSKTKTHTIKPVLVTPNQKVVLNKATQRIVKRLTASPIPIMPLSQITPNLEFEESKVIDILRALSLSFGIDIDIAQDAIIDCRLTTTVTEKSLYQNLDIICYPLGLRYYEQDGKIMITGKCRN